MRERWVVAAIVVLVVLTRLPFLAHQLVEWDSVLYARALEHGFHVDTQIASERPHPPGYIFYVGLAALFRLVTADSNAALVILSVLASAFAAAAVYLLARHFAPRVPAVAAALGFALSPLLWYQSEIALPYTLLALLCVALAAAFRHARTGAHSVLVALAFGLASGFRQDVALILGLLWLWSIAPLAWPTRVRALAGVALGCVAWLVPSAALSGGLAAYLDANIRQAGNVATFSLAERGIDGLTHNLALALYALGWGAAAFALPIVILGGARLLHRRRAGGDVAFFALWIAPPLVVYVGLHIGEPGYVLSLLPAIYVLSAILLAAVTRNPGAAGALGGALVVANAAVFLFLSGSYSAAAIAGHDRSIADRVAYVRAHFTPATTYVVAQFDYEFARYYLPEFRTLFDGDSPEVLSRTPVAVALDPHRDTLVLFGPVPDLGPGLRREPAPGDLGPALATVAGDGGATLGAYDVEPPAGER